MEWTAEQKKVIELRNRNILVSAAAGSGKTAVLVARIISLISEGENPIDIDRLLIVTFTNAAAAEMRERIGKAIDEKVRDNPESAHLQKQMTLIHSAQITTIHSFCLNVIRNHFNTIDLDPSFRIAEEAELVLLKSDVLSDLLEEHYEKGEKEFLNFIESFSSGKTDEPIEELVLKLHQFSMSYPWPKEWLEEIKQTFLISSIDEMKNMPWMRALISYLQVMLLDLGKKCEDEIALCEEIDGPKAYLPAIRDDYDQIQRLSEVTDYEEYEKSFRDFSFSRLSSKKEVGVSDDIKNRVKAMRDEVKKTINDMKKNFFFQSSEEMLLDIMAMKNAMMVLIDLTTEFMDEYAKKKEDKNIVDFNDLEHFALRILTNKVDSKEIPSDAANELSEYYEEIMIDEYQDSNYVQETILKSISKERFGRGNLFMVGDVKQSIYKFRLARPELFMEKFNTYNTSDKEDHESLENISQRIDLHKNFRSRSVVLDSINFVFEQIMTEKLGNILYNHEAALYPGADFGPFIKGESEDTEIILVPLDDESVEGEEDSSLIKDYDSKEEKGLEEEYTGKELEARVIAKRIKELTDSTKGLMIYDKEKKTNRIATCSDIVILLRTMSGYSEVFIDTLGAEGIASHADTQTGYFQTLEIRTVLNLLRIIDNPRQDIPFTAILRSPMVGLTSDSLALIRITKRKIPMYEAVKNYLALEKGDELSYQLDTFMKKLSKYRTWVSYLPIHELLLKVLADTGYYDFISAMPSGAKRKANVDMLLERAIRFEATSYTGLFQFVRYMEKLNKYNIDYGEAKIVGKEDNTVKIMSIHKSKGLEFPVVIVAGMGKNFNNQDSRGSVLIHPDLGLGPDFLDHTLRIKGPTLVKKTIQKLIVLENLAEELRILYVAMTRAKEKLILVGGVKKLEDKLSKWSNVITREEKQLLYYQISSANTYFDWIIPATMRHRGFSYLLEDCNIRENTNHQLYHSDAKMVITKHKLTTFLDNESAIQTFKNMNKEELLNWDNSIVYSEKIKNDIEESISYVYPYEIEANIKAKLTVSELKRLGQSELEEYGEQLIKAPRGEKEEEIPSFIEKQISGVDIGTLYHTVLEYIDFEAINNALDINNALLAMVDKNKIKIQEYHSLDVNKLYQFTKSNIAERMKRAKREGKLFKERQFVMGIKANEINPLLKSEELVLVQGVIDVYFMEDGEYVLLDYKTDAINSKNGASILKKRYSVQLNYYEKALMQITGIKVKEKIIYSFGLNEEIYI